MLENVIDRMKWQSWTRMSQPYITVCFAWDGLRSKVRPAKNCKLFQEMTTSQKDYEADKVICK